MLRPQGRSGADHRSKGPAARYRARPMPHRHRTADLFPSQYNCPGWDLARTSVRRGLHCRPHELSTDAMTMQVKVQENMQKVQGRARFAKRAERTGCVQSTDPLQPAIMPTTAQRAGARHRPRPRPRRWMLTADAKGRGGSADRPRFQGPAVGGPAAARRLHDFVYQPSGSLHRLTQGAFSSRCEQKADRQGTSEGASGARCSAPTQERRAVARSARGKELAAGHGPSFRGCEVRRSDVVSRTS